MTHDENLPLDRSPVLLVPGYWLGGWAWERVAPRLEDSGRHVEAITLPGLESAGSDRSRVRFRDHVDRVREGIRAAGAPCVLVVHSGAGAVATAVADGAPELLRRIVYVDSGPVSDGSIPTSDLPEHAVELPFPGFGALAGGGVSAEGLTDDDLTLIEARAVPHPAGAIREPIDLRNPNRNRVPVTLVCCSIPGEAVGNLARSGSPMFAPVVDLMDVTTVDLPTGHWPMFSRPDELAAVIADEASRV